MIKVLLVDDDVINLHIVSEKLRKEEIDTLAINNPLEFNKSFESFSPDLILLDVVMPGESGMAVLKRIRELKDKNELPVIMMTANDSDEDIIAALDGGANDYITKPVNINIAISRIKAQLSQRDLSRDLVRKKESEALRSLIATYSHEINNPLAVAIGNLSRVKKKLSDPQIELLKPLEESLLRIKEIVRKLQMEATASQLEYEEYSEKSRLLKIK